MRNTKKKFVMVAPPPAPRNRKISTLVVKGDEPSHLDELLAALIGGGLIVLTVVELLWLPLLAE